LDPEGIKILSLGVIWNFSKETGLSSFEITLRGTKDPSVRPRCIGTIRVRIHCQSINQSINRKCHQFIWYCTNIHCNTFLWLPICKKLYV